MVHQERRERGRSLINPHTAHSSSSHLPTPGLRSSHLGCGLRLPERIGLASLRMAVAQTTGTAWHCHPVPPQPRAGVDVGAQTLFRPLQGQRDGGRAGAASAQQKRSCCGAGSLLRDTRGEGARLVPRGRSGAEGTRQGSHAPKTIRKVPGAKVYLVQ